MNNKKIKTRCIAALTLMLIVCGVGPLNLNNTVSTSHAAALKDIYGVTIGGTKCCTHSVKAKTSIYAFAGTSTSTKTVRAISKGSLVTVTHKTNSWYRVKLDNGKTGWVRRCDVVSLLK